MRTASSLLPGALAIVLAATGAAHAQAVEAAATAQFDQGRALMKQKKYPEACAAFEQSQKLDPEMGTLYNLAACHVQVGKLATAWLEYRNIEMGDHDPARAKDAGKRAKALFPRLSKLHLEVPMKPPGLVVQLDGADVTVLVGTDAPVDIGTHEIVATAPGYLDAHETAMVGAEAATETVTVELSKKGEVAKVSRKAPARAERAREREADGEREQPEREQPAPEDAVMHPHRKLGIALTAAGAVLVGVSVAFGVGASDRWNQAKALCGDDLMCPTAGTLTAGKQLASYAQTDALLCTGLAIGGAAAIGVGILLIVRSSHGETQAETSAAWRVVPTATPTAAGIALGGRF